MLHKNIQCDPSLEPPHRNSCNERSQDIHENIHCDPLLEPSHQDGSNEGSQDMFSLRNKKIIFDLSSIPHLIWSSAYNVLLLEIVLSMVNTVPYLVEYKTGFSLPKLSSKSILQQFLKFRA